MGNHQQIYIKDIQSGEILWSGGLEDLEKGHSEAARLCEIGLDIELISPSVVHSLAQELGQSQEDLELLDTELQEEHDSHHDDSCCYKAE